MNLYGIEIPEKEKFKSLFNDILKGKGGVLLYLSIIGIILGIYAVARIVIEGHGYITNTNSQVPWGLQITTYIFLVLNGCTFMNLIGNYFFKKEYEPYALKVVFFGIFAALSGMGALATELGHVERLYLWALSPNPSSMMWWMAVWYTIYLITIIIEFISLKMHKHSKTLMWITFLSALATSSTLGALIGVVEQRAYYYSALLPIYLPIISFLMGGVVLTIMSSISAKKSPTGDDPLLKPAINSFKVGLGIFFVVTVWRLIVGSYGQAEGMEIFEMSLNFQILVVLYLGTVLPFIILSTTKNPNYYIIASLITVFVHILARIDIVSGAFKLPLFRAYDIPAVISYIPSHVEIFIFIASASFAVFVYLLADKLGFLEVKEEA